MSERVDFDLPLFGATVYHNTPNSDGVWSRCFNAPKDDKTAQIEKVKELFEQDGFNVIRILEIEIYELLKGG
ncbi:hypothetical protein [Streptomyces sp. NPDC048720]|uniref:hypothetical protein n=1 Tax=Streptomyces sp. NPDC048720 TaxID=3365588 RepID=UPI0037170F2B